MGMFDWLGKKVGSQKEEKSVLNKSNFHNFKKVTDYIYDKSGIIDLDKRAFTASRLQQYSESQEIYTTNELINEMQKNEIFYQEILNIATVNETFFMRELKELECLVEYISVSKTKLKILSLPSSSGEEVYSILLLMLEKGLSLDKVSINGFDINSDAVKRAKEGVYDEHALHKLSKDTKEKYFIVNENANYEISRLLKDKVDFSQENIFDLNETKIKYDIILSRNMFIYFDDLKRAEALNIICKLLKADGLYIKGHADLIEMHPNLEKITYGIYKKV